MYRLYMCEIFRGTAHVVFLLFFVVVAVLIRERGSEYGKVVCGEAGMRKKKRKKGGGLYVRKIVVVVDRGGRERQRERERGEKENNGMAQ